MSIRKGSKTEKQIIQAIREGGKGRYRALKQIFKDQQLRGVAREVQEKGGGVEFDFFPLFKDCIIFFDRFIRLFPNAEFDNLKTLFEKIAKYKWSISLRKNQRFRESVIQFVVNDKELPNRLKARIINGGGSEEDSKDFYQDGFEKLRELLYSGTYGGGAIKSFYLQVCYNLWRNERKKTKPHALDETEPLLADEISNPHRLLEIKEFNEKYYAAFQKLDKRCREILELKFFRRESFSMKEIAFKMGYGSPQSAANAIFRCKKKWKEQINDPK